MTYKILFAALLTLTVSFGGLSRAQTTDDQVIAVVNGEAVTEAQVIMFYKSLGPQYQQTPLAMLRGQLVESLIERKLLAQAARRAGVLDDEEVKLRLSYLEDEVLQQAYLGRIIEDRVTEERLRAAYDAMVANFGGGDEIRARHILLETEDEAKAVIAEIEAGADFAEVAKQRSTGPSGPNGGDLGYFVKDMMVAPFAAAAFDLAVGSTTAEPVETQFGWHVIMVEDRRPTVPPSFEAAEDNLRAMESQAAFEAFMVDLQDSAVIERLDGGNATESE